ncbi:DUF1016 N-terminal domain-containing protein [Streptomyces sp. NPDC006320]
MYGEIGRVILRRRRGEKCGTKVIGRVVTELGTEFPGQRGFSTRDLQYMRQMARTRPDSIAQQTVAQSPWGHVVLLMGKCATRFELDFYAQHTAHGRSGPAAPPHSTYPDRRPAPHHVQPPHHALPAASAPLSRSPHPRPRSPYARPHDD